jgi:glycerophosphoryl diester phosphodiesterase
MRTLLLSSLMLLSACTSTRPMGSAPVGASSDDPTLSLMASLRTQAGPAPGCSPNAALLKPGGGIDLERLQAAGYPVVVWTVNDLPTMQELLRRGVNGIITDRPDLLVHAVRDFDADGDGIPGDLLDTEDRIDPKRFDAQGHRGARGLRPENTLPSFEAALDSGMTTLEMDTVLTADGVPVISHDPNLLPERCRYVDGSPLPSPVPIASLSVTRLQADFVCDRILEAWPEQHNDRALSPKAVAFAAQAGLPDAYTVPTLAQLFAFAGAGSQRVSFNVELKRPARKADIAPAHVDAVVRDIRAAKLGERADVQSFDVNALRILRARHPDIRAVVLLEELPLNPGI